METKQMELKKYGEVFKDFKELEDKIFAIRLPYTITIPVEIEGKTKYVKVNCVAESELGRVWGFHQSDDQGMWFYCPKYYVLPENTEIVN